MSAAAAAGGDASPARESGGRAEWLRVYDRMVAILRKNHGHVQALLADRSRLEALLKVQHDFWTARDRLRRDSLSETRRAEACVRRCDEAKLELLLGDKDRELHRYQIYAEHQDDDLEDFRACAIALAEENTRLKLKLEEVENSADLSEKTREHEHGGRNLRDEIRELKRAYKNLSSSKDKEVSALDAHKDFVWNQFKTMETNYESLLKKKTIKAEQAAEEAKKLQQKVEELQVAAQKKDDDIGRLQAEANAAKKLILVLEDKLQKMHSLASVKDDEIQKVKAGHLQASQKRKRDISGSRRKSRSEGHSQRGKSKNNPRRQMVDEDQPETSQKRHCASSLSNGVGLRRCSSRMNLKPAVSPAPRQVLFHSSFKVPKLKTPPAPPPPRPL